MRWWSGLLVCLLGCGAVSPAQRVTEAFLDAYYVQVDLATAQGFTEGYARDKVREGRALTEGQVIDTTTRKPSVHYKLLSTEERGAEEVVYLYQLTIRLEKAERVEKKTYIKTRRHGDVWKVTLFREL